MTTAFFRTVILYFILMVGLRLMGKRQIGELEPSELVLTLIISDLAAVPMQDFGIPLVNGVFPIVTLLCLSMLISFFSLRSIRFRGLVCGHPTVIIRDGKILQQNMARNRFTVDELLEQLRSQGYSDLSSVKYAILETSGQVSVLPYTKASPVTPQVMNQDVQDDVTLPTLLINDGHIMSANLSASGYDQVWLDKQLKDRRLTSPRQVFFLTVDETGTVVCVAKEGEQLKAFYIPTGLLVLILGFSLWAGRYVELRTENWSAQLEAADAAARQEDWEEAGQRLFDAYQDWSGSQTFFHTIMEHDELDEAENLFAGAFAVCREADGADFHQLLSQLINQLHLLAETQSVSVKNVL